MSKPGKWNDIVHNSPRILLDATLLPILRCLEAVLLMVEIGDALQEIIQAWGRYSLSNPRRTCFMSNLSSKKTEFLLINLLIPCPSYLFIFTMCGSFTVHISTNLSRDILTLTYSLISLMHFWSSSMKSFQKIDIDKKRNAIFNWQNNCWRAVTLEWNS